MSDTPSVEPKVPNFFKMRRVQWKRQKKAA